MRRCCVSSALCGLLCVVAVCCLRSLRLCCSMVAVRLLLVVSVCCLLLFLVYCTLFICM